VTQTQISLNGGQSRRHNRALFLSDLHLATRRCRADPLLNFLEHNEADTIYLVGDIIDLSGVKRRRVWPHTHSHVIEALLQKMHRGTRLVIIPGNHDAGLRAYCGTRLGGVEVMRECVHTTKSGRRLLVMHGNEFAGSARWVGILRRLGERAHGLGRLCTLLLCWLRSRIDRSRWPLVAGGRRKAATHDNFEQALVDEARRRRLDGVVCGHLHRAARSMIGGIAYLNCGDWVASCTAIAENAAGELAVVSWQQPIHA
jgi:UDP-2,3-diacylglucosamine pyrophosphatase LpxH